MTSSRGKLIAIEGIDGAGTSTQARMLVTWMNENDLPAHLTCEPSTGPLGRLLREILAGQTRPVDPAALALLFAGDRVDHVRSEICTILDRGAHVVTDRYVYSSLAYQSMDLDLGWVARINSLAPEPDLTAYLRIDPELAEERRSIRGEAQELFETRSSQTRISAIYDDIFGSEAGQGSWSLRPGGSEWIRADPAKDPRGSSLLRDPIQRQPEWVSLDGSLPIDALHQQLRNLVQKICLAE
jgi:dTMP kinase